MCLACEEQEMMFRYYVERKLADGEMPEGVTAAELQAMGYVLPTGLRAAAQSTKAAAAGSFVCDTPDGE